MRVLALGAIAGYQRWISPYKGFCCAHRVHLGGASCSVAGARLIRRYGLLSGLVLLRERLRRCGEVHARHPARPPLQGDCDLPCVDLPDLDCGSSPGRGLSACDCCSCDWPSSRREDRKRRRPTDTKPTR